MIKFLIRTRIENQTFYIQNRSIAWLFKNCTCFHEADETLGDRDVFSPRDTLDIHGGLGIKMFRLMIGIILAGISTTDLFNF